MSLLRRIEKKMDARLRGIFSAGSEQPGAREAIEMYRDALEQVRSRVTRGNRGERLFPFNLISIDLALAASDPERKAVLEAMFVHPAHRGKGIGSALIQEAGRLAVGAGCQRLELTSNKARTRAHKFYEKCGFKATHEGFKLILAK